MQFGEYLVGLLKKLQAINPVAYTVVSILIIVFWALLEFGFIKADGISAEVRSLVAILALALMGAKVAPEPADEPEN